jgi:pimeloyl-ACP methyl ester carboxylesterase
MNTTLTRSIKPQFEMIDGVKIRYADSGGSHEPTLLLTSPWSESLYAFRRLWDTLAAHARLLAIDLPGFRRIRTTRRSALPTSDGCISRPAHHRG